ncbi:ZYRO0A11748p [Zygosaccharomyces rouxii]|uniref:Elongation factor 1 alpha-like protein n=1 Tax=Zygosaccharomyces rouxii (strain ATCC 2623 / CBS 732 / NBRC 1130 / NCYC 568 / NRRL Y-229) TaxID=559307 RepID=C5DNV2_ZYGRC|nr:uncharacterized protein ZYRO0A11748g [Zygosaccharomyces rouxii]CAR25943.1 ZYRO0A11748p [Zygosaccharomyces rouxii]
MVAYEDDDLMDYEEELPEFENEADLDEYLNDDEYELMNQLFPHVKKEMVDYQGWDNFALKKTIFETNFDPDESLKILKRSFKKKKSEAAKTKAVENFKKPSPDDVVLEAQSRALDNVTENVSKLKVQEEKQAKQQSQPKLATKPTKPTDPIDIQNYLSKGKPHCSFVVIGHVDSGKSTLMGRVLYDLGVVDISHLRKLKRESEIVGKSSFHLAWVMDQTPEERERGVTVSVCTNDFETPSTRFTIVDAPGHRDFVPNAIAGISEADAAVLSIDCGTDAFESGFNLDGQTKEHTLLARSLGVGHIIVAMNKMDTVDWYQERFEQIRRELSSFFETIGYRPEQISWIPCSGLTGANVVKRTTHEMQNWYQGRSLVEELEYKAEQIEKSYQEDIINAPFLFSITEVISVNKNEEVVVSGKVESGSIQPGETLNIFPSEQSVVVNRITIDNNERKVPVATKGDFAVLRLRNAFAEIIEAGDLAASVGVEIPVRNTLKVQALTFQMSRPLLPGTPFMFFKGVNEQPARVSKLNSIIDKQDPSKIIKKKVKHLGSNQAAIFEIELVEKERWIPFLTSTQNRRMSRIVMRKEGRTIAAGTIIE